MKKIIYIIFSVIISLTCIAFTSCSNQSDNISETMLTCTKEISETTYINDIKFYQTNPTTEAVNGEYIEWFGVYEESDYSNIVANTEFSEYSTNTKIIKCTITNQNPGKAFYVFNYPFIERYESDK